MQTLCLNELVKKTQLNFFLPPEIREEFEQLAKPLGSKKKWMMGAVAILTLLQQSPEHIAEMLRMVGTADLEKTYGDLVAKIKPKKKRIRAQEVKSPHGLKGVILHEENA
jgi:hypothetical protein